MTKTRYRVAPHNRLIIEHIDDITGMVTFQKIVEGTFSSGETGDLSYRVKEHLDKGGAREIRFSGKWGLTKEHELKFTVSGKDDGVLKSELCLAGEIIDAGEHALVFSMTTRRVDGGSSAYLLKVNGFWQADAGNRITFQVQKEYGPGDAFTFEGAWEINKDHQIQYSYERAALRTKAKKTHTIVFRGHWDIKDKKRISYYLGGSTESVFDFKTSIGILRENYVKYDLGIWLKGRTRGIKRSVILYGTWNVKKGSGLSFDIAYADREICSISFDAFARLTGDDTVRFSLSRERDKELGLELELSHDLLKGDVSAFLKFLKQGPETGIYVGVGGKW